jgi:hypothetical protein
VLINVQYAISSLLNQYIYRAIHEQKVLEKRTSQHWNFLKFFKLFELFCRVVEFYFQALEFCIAEHARERQRTPENARARHSTPEHASARQSTLENGRARQCTPVHANARQSTPMLASARQSTPEHARAG